MSVDFRLRIKRLPQLFELSRYAGNMQKLYGYDGSGKKRCSFGVGTGVVVIDDGAIGRWRMRDFLREENRAYHIYLLTLTWVPACGWTGSPLELLALAGNED